MKLDLIYLAAGEGKRAKLGYPKQLARLGGKQILVHALEQFAKVAEIGTVVVACPIGRNAEFAGLLCRYGLSVCCIEGGATRQESVRLALEHVETEYVLIHEAVRPFVTEELIRAVISAKGDAVTPWLPGIASTLLTLGCFFDRNQVGQVQMPQRFATAVLRDAHANADSNDYTDDAHLVWARAGVFPELLPGLEGNIKITTPLDLIIAEAIYNARYAEE